MPAVVEDTFEIGGRGLIAVIARSDAVPPTGPLHAVVVRPDGSTVETQAFREILLNPTKNLDKEGFLLASLSKADVPIGSMIELTTTPRSGEDL